MFASVHLKYVAKMNADALKPKLEVTHICAFNWAKRQVASDVYEYVTFFAKWVSLSNLFLVHLKQTEQVGTEYGETRFQLEALQACV